MTDDTLTTDVVAEDKEAPRPRRQAIRLPVVIAGVMVVAGFCALAIAWYHAGNTDQLWIQNQELVSGGLGGLGLIIVGSTLLIRDALVHGRPAVEHR